MPGLVALSRFVPTAWVLAVGACGEADLVLPPGSEGEPSPSRSTVSAFPPAIPVGPGASTITVRVMDPDGKPVEGATVTLEASGSGNSLAQPAGPTGSDGIATGSLQSAVPETKEISATVNGSLRVTQTVVITVTSVTPARIAPLQGDGQSVRAGTPVPVPPAVQVLDAAGEPVPGVRVTFAVPTGGGSAQEPVQTTDADGIARVGGWTLGAVAGTNTLEARAGELEGSPVVFTARGTAEEDDVERLVYLVQPPAKLRLDRRITVEVALVNAAGDVVPLSGIFIYLGLFKDGKDVPNNEPLIGERFENTQDGVAVFELRVAKKGAYRLRALTDDLPRFGRGGPKPYLFSELFEVD